MSITDKLARIVTASRRSRSLAEISAACEVDPAILSRVARGHSAPSLANAEKIARGLGYRLELNKAPQRRRATPKKGG